MSELVRSGDVFAEKPTVRGNIASIARMQEQLEERRGWADKLADVIGDFSGTMTFVLIHVVVFTLWFLINTGVIPGIKRFDPYPFILLAMTVSVEGVLLSTFVLMKQNRMQRQSDTRAHINLQIDLLAEEEVTKSLQMLRAICRKLEIDEKSFGAELEEMASFTSVDVLTEDVEKELMEQKR